MPITCDGVQYYTPIWHGNNFTPYVANPSALGETINASSATFNGNGTTSVTGGTAAPSNWFSPTTTNIGGGYYIKITKTAGLSGLAFSAANGVWTAITTGGITVSSNAASTISGTYQLSTSITGTPVVANGAITLSGNNGVQRAPYNGATPIVLAGDGTATLNGVSTSNWYAPTTGSIGAGFWIKITQTGGTSGYSFSAANGVYTNITTGGLTIGISGPAGSNFNVSGTYIIASDSGGVNQLGTGSITLTGGSNVQSANWSGTTPLSLIGDGSAAVGGFTSTSWYSPTAANVGSGYWIKITRTSGTAGVNFSAAQGSWTNITNTRLTIDMTGFSGDVGTVTVGGTYQISNSSGGTPVLGSGTISLSVNAGTVTHIYTSGAGKTETIPTGSTTCVIEEFGGSGGGGGTQSGGGGGGGAGGYSRTSLSVAAQNGRTFTYTVGAAGAAGTTGGGGTNGGAGGVSTVVAGTVTGFSTMTANGGGGGVFSLSGGGAGGSGGTASGGTAANTTGHAGTAGNGPGGTGGDGATGTVGVNGSGANGGIGASSGPIIQPTAGGVGKIIFKYS